MPVSGNFNTDSKALENRINAHSKFGSRDINEWIFENLEINEDLSVLDLGCGTGKQSIPIAEIVGVKGSVTSVDISKESLNTLAREADAKSLADRIHLINCGLDELKDKIEEDSYDRVLSSFSIYYAKDPAELLRTVKKTLKKNGIFFFCGPSLQNNIELKLFHQKIKNITLPQSEGALFLEDSGQQTAKELFGNITINKFENVLKFDSAEALYKYWSSYNLYDPGIDEQFKQAAKEHFKTNQFFETSKRVIGIKVIKE
jgi:ubiquinone/menaquinone biosynthesis C-methylase UbiE